MQIERKGKLVIFHYSSDRVATEAKKKFCELRRITKKNDSLFWEFFDIVEDNFEVELQQRREQKSFITRMKRGEITGVY